MILEVYFANVLAILAPFDAAPPPGINPRTSIPKLVARFPKSLESRPSSKASAKNVPNDDTAPVAAETTEPAPGMKADPIDIISAAIVPRRNISVLVNPSLGF